MSLNNKFSLFFLNFLIVCVSFSYSQSLENNTSYKAIKDSMRKYAKQKDFKQAKDYALKFESEIIKSNDSLVLQDYYVKQGYNYSKLGGFSNAIKYYYNSYAINLLLKDSLKTADRLLTIANLQRSLGDYPGSELSSVEALRLKPKESNIIYGHYLNLANTSNELSDYENAIYYANKAITSTKDSLRIIKALNTKGLIFNQKKEYQESIALFDSIFLLFKSSLKKYPKTHARIIDNRSYGFFKNGNLDLAEQEMLKALQIRREQKDHRGQFASYIHLSELYKKKEQHSAAVNYAIEALKIAKKIKSPRFKLEALEQLIKTKDDPKKETLVFLALNDSLQKARNKTKNQFSKIKYDSEQNKKAIITLQNDTLQKDLILIKKQKENLGLFTTIGILLLLIIIGYLFVLQRKKRIERMHLIDKLQSKEKERNRLSGNVHDSLAGSLRVAMNKVDSLNKTEKNPILGDVGDSLEIAYEKARSISQDYQSPDFSKISFVKHTKSLLFERSQEYDLIINEEDINSIEWKDISNEIKIEFYRILQECLLNIHKHANAEIVSIQFNSEVNYINLTIADDGNGITTVSENFENVGLSNLKNRIEDLNGSVHIYSEKNKGFSITIGIPLII